LAHRWPRTRREGCAGRAAKEATHGSRAVALVGQFPRSDGARQILTLDGILLIPLLFPMSFFSLTVPMIAVVTVMVIAAVRAMPTHQHTHP
jgi:hypothetical protein